MRDEELVAVCVGVGLVVLTSAFVSLRRSAREREMRHAERLRALEHGLVLDELDEERQIRRGMLKLATGLGIVVPIAAIACAAAAVVNMPTQAISTLTVFLIWTGAAAVGLAAVVSGAWLANATLTRLRPENRSSASASAQYGRVYGRQEAAAAN